MTRAVCLANDDVLVCLDDKGIVRDVSFPHVGAENHVLGKAHKLILYIEGNAYFLDDKNYFNIDVSYYKNSLVSLTKYSSDKLGISLAFEDAVHNSKKIFMRRATITNHKDYPRDVKLFFHQHYHLGGAHVGDSIYYNLKHNCIIQYKERRYLLFSLRHHDEFFNEYAIGTTDLPGFEGTYMDALDGHLSRNNVDHGTVDSTMGFSVKMPKYGSCHLDYWTCFGRSFSEVLTLHQWIQKRSLESLIRSVNAHWNHWVNSLKLKCYELPHNISDLFERSLLFISTHADKGGAIIASADTDILKLKRDTYGYTWPRDGALIARSLDRCGHASITKKFFEFCMETITREGFMLHKFWPDRSLGSSWHPWIVRGQPTIPLQEDQTALPTYAMWKHYETYNDKNLLKEHYNRFIKPAADF